MQHLVPDDPEFSTLCEQLAQRTGALDQEAAWPSEQLHRLGDAGVLGWVIPKQYGGGELDDEVLLIGYERLAAACLTTTFVLTQRNGACQRIALSKNDDLKAELLPKLCNDAMFATVGISHLTTSRQHLGKPAVRAEQQGDHWRLHGCVPWVTGGQQADFIVTGGSCDDGTQVLISVPTKAPGVTLHAAPHLLSLNGSQTGPVDLDHVELPEKYVLAGPISHVMKQGLGGSTGSLTTSALALGATTGVLANFQREAAHRSDLVDIHNALATERAEISGDMHRAAKQDALSSNSTGDPALSSESIRRRANSLVLRAAQAYLAASKGAGFVAGHPAERAVREAMFFLVWSCPAPVVAANLREFACVLEGL